ncbi:MAG: hypothetical protein OHK0019_30310 [Saprospiraceae bacterium]
MAAVLNEKTTKIRRFSKFQAPHEQKKYLCENLHGKHPLSIFTNSIEVSSLASYAREKDFKKK